MFTLTTMLLGDDRAADDPHLIVSGKVSGLLGTDNAKRDLWNGIVAGVKWALMIGLLTAFVSVAVGVIAGIASAYYRAGSRSSSSASSRSSSTCRCCPC